MINFDDYGLNEEANELIIKLAPKIPHCSISILANRVRKEEINALEDVFLGVVNLHVDLVEGPFLLSQHKPNSVENISAEILAQLKRIIDHGLSPRLIDFHQNAHKKINVMRALSNISQNIKQYQLRPLIQSRLMRRDHFIIYKNIGALIAQNILKNSVSFAEGVVMSGLDSFPHDRWPELFEYITNNNYIIPCHPHLYQSEKLFCEYISQNNIN